MRRTLNNLLVASYSTLAAAACQPDLKVISSSDLGIHLVVEGDAIRNEYSGVDLRVDVLYTNGFKGSFLPSDQNTGDRDLPLDQVLFESGYSSQEITPAFFGINVIPHRIDGWQLKVEITSPESFYDRCKNISPDPALCTGMIPTQAMPEETLVRTETGYVGKTNSKNYPELAECAAGVMETTALTLSDFFNTNPLRPDASLSYINTNNQKGNGLTLGNLAQWFLDDSEIQERVLSCSKYSKIGQMPVDHEASHAVILNYLGVNVNSLLPLALHEGLANWLPRHLNKEIFSNPHLQEAVPEDLICNQEGFTYKGKEHPYADVYGDYTPLWYPTGECLWKMLVADHGASIIPKIFQVLYDHRMEAGFNFVDGLRNADATIDFEKYRHFLFDN